MKVQERKGVGARNTFKMSPKTAIVPPQNGPNITAVKNTETNLNLTFTDAKGYGEKREELLKNTLHVTWEELLETIGENGNFFIGEDFCGLIEAEDERAFLREFIGDKKGVDAVLSRLSFKTATVRTNELNKPFGMLFPLKEIKPCKMYMGFAMD